MFHSVGDIDNGGRCAYWGIRGYVGNLCTSQFFCECKTAIKKNSVKTMGQKYMWRRNKYGLIRESSKERIIPNPILEG